MPAHAQPPLPSGAVFRPARRLLEGTARPPAARKCPATKLECRSATQDEKYLERMEKTLDWIEKHQADREFGGWYWGVLEDGKIGPRGDNKGEEWKAIYHDLRALVFTSEWITKRR